MVGIIKYGAYVPYYRLGKGTAGWQGPEKAVGNWDEDAITMGVAAADDCLTGFDRSQVDGLFFASTTSPYGEKQAATLMAAALDLRTDILTTDFGNSLRAGVGALIASVDAVASGRAKTLMVVIADRRLSQAGSDLETWFADGASAFLVGRDKVIAELVTSYALSHEIVDVYRSSDDAFVRSWEDRFVMDEGYLNAMSKAVGAALRKGKLEEKDIRKAVFYGPDARRHGELSKKLGFADSQIQPFPATLGDTGAALAPMMLVQALEQAQSGDKILLAGYGQGADVLVLAATTEVSSLAPVRGMTKHLANKKLLPDYNKVLTWKNILNVAPRARRPAQVTPAAAAMYRENDSNLRRHGVKCVACGAIQFPIRRVCIECRSKDNFDSVRMSDKGVLFTYSYDYLAPTLDSPTVTSIVDFDGGGRIMCNMTDRAAEEIKVGMPVEFSFRWLHTAEGIHNYFWKCVPART